MAEKLNGIPQAPELKERVIGKVIYRDGSQIDEIRQV
jgi:citrate lyase alpha subunit